MSLFARGRFHGSPALVVAASIAIACSGTEGGGGGPPPGEGTPPAGREVGVLRQARASQLLLRGANLYWLGSGGVHRLSLEDGSDLQLFEPLPFPEQLATDGASVFWTSGGALFRSTPDGSSHELLDTAPGFAAKTSLALDDDAVYWVPDCVTPCTFTVRRVPKAGGPVTTVVSAAQEIMAIAVAGGQVYWEERGFPVELDGTTGSALKRISLADGGVTVIVNGRLNGLLPPPLPGNLPGSWLPTGGIAVDQTHVYFSDTHRLLAVPTGGGAVAVLANVARMDDYVRAMDVDDASVYWLDGPSVLATPKAGGATVELAAGPAVSLARSGGTLFWVETACCGHGQKGNIRKIPVAGGPPTTLKVGADAPMMVAADASHAYWVEGGPVGGLEGFGSISRVTHDGAHETLLFEGGGGALFDVAGDDVYLASRFTVKTVPAAGGKLRRLAIGDFFVVGLAADAEHVFWVEDLPIAVARRVPRAGGPMITLATSDGPVGKLVLDGTDVYWMVRDESVARVPKDGGAVTAPIGVVAGFITDFAVEGGHVYYAEWDGNDGPPRVRRVPLGGGGAATLATLSPDQTRLLAVDGESVYWFDQFEVAKVPVSGGSPEHVASPAADAFFPGGIAVDATSLYFADLAAGQICAATPK